MAKMAPVPHPPYIYTQSSLCDFTAPPIKSLDTPSLDSGLVIALLWPIEFSRSDIVPVLSLGLNRPCMFPLPLPLPFPLPPSHPPPPPTPAQSQTQASLLDDDAYMDQSPPLPQPATNESLEAEPPS